MAGTAKMSNLVLWRFCTTLVLSTLHLPTPTIGDQQGKKMFVTQKTKEKGKMDIASFDKSLSERCALQSVCQTKKKKFLKNAIESR